MFSYFLTLINNLINILKIPISLTIICFKFTLENFILFYRFIFTFLFFNLQSINFFFFNFQVQYNFFLIFLKEFNTRFNVFIFEFTNVYSIQ